MLKDTKLSTSTHVALNAPEPGNSNGTAVYTPVLTPKDNKPTTAATRVFVFGNCPTRPNGLGNNVSKLGLGCKAAGIWGRNLGQIGGKATISSHGQQSSSWATAAGQPSRPTECKWAMAAVSLPAYSHDEFSPLLSSHYCLPLLRS